MKRRLFIFAVFTLVVASGSVRAELTDPYEILHKHYEAVGGLEKLKAQTTSFVTGKIILEGTGLEGTFKHWSERPIKSRQEIDLTVITQTVGDNGKFAWTVDHNGKLHIQQDEKTTNQRQITILMDAYEHLNPKSDVFTVTYEGIDSVDGVACYLVKITNSLNAEEVTSYYDCNNFMELKSITITPDNQEHTLYSDYRRVGGVLLPYSQTTTEFPTGMVQRVVIDSIAVNLDIDPTLFEPPSADVEDFRFPDGAGVVQVPFKFIENHIYVPLEVGGKERLWVLDSGAGATCIAKSFSNELGLKSEGSIKGRGAGNLVDVSFVVLPEFSLAGLTFDRQKVVVLELNQIFRKLLGKELAGILGYDFLSRLVVKIDYANEELSFFHPDSFRYTGDGVVIDAPISQDNMFHLSATVDGQYEGKWNLDLGAGGLSFHYPYAEKHRFAEREGIEHIGYGAGGASRSRLVKFDTIELAGFTVHNPIIGVPLQSGKGAFAGGELAGNLGNTLFRHFVLYLDYPRQRVIIEKGANFGHDFPVDGSGIQLEYTADQAIRISFIVPGGPGDRAGLQAGDLLQTINGIDVGHLDGLVAVREMFRAKTGTTYQLGVMRDGAEHTRALVLSDLFK